MPEGHTIHRLAGGLNRRFAGVPVTLSSPQGRFSESADRLAGATFVRATAHGKHLFADFGAGRTVHVHLGLYGRVAFGVFGAKAAVPVTGRWGGRDISYVAPAAVASTADATGGPAVPGGASSSSSVAADVAADEEDDDGAAAEYAEDGADAPPEPRGAVRLRVVGDGDYLDLRGPTACDLLDPTEVAAIHARLGPDPLRRDGHEEEFVARVRARRVDVGALLMDQRMIAGVGNVYRAEILFRHGLSPFRLGRDVSEATLAAMWEDLRLLMRHGVRSGRIVTTRPPDRPHPRGYVRRDEAHYVYKRSALACRVCGSPVSTQVMVGRNLFWCPHCQPQ